MVGQGEDGAVLSGMIGGVGVLNSPTSSLQTLALDDGSGLRVVRASFVDEEKFDWALFEGFESLRVLTYSASSSAVVRMLDDFSFERFECVFGSEGRLGNFLEVLAFQQVVTGQTRAAIMGLKDDRHRRILERIAKGQARFWSFANMWPMPSFFCCTRRTGPG